MPMPVGTVLTIGFKPNGQEFTALNRERAARVLAAMNTMRKFDIAGLEAEYVGE